MRILYHLVQGLIILLVLIVLIVFTAFIWTEVELLAQIVLTAGIWALVLFGVLAWLKEKLL